MVRGFAAATASISESCCGPSEIVVRSRPSSAIVPANTTATSDDRAAVSASARLALSSATTVSDAVACEPNDASVRRIPSSGVAV